MKTGEPPAARTQSQNARRIAEVLTKTGRENVAYQTILDTLALAYVRAGETVKAIGTEEPALSLLPPEDLSWRKELEGSLGRFRRAATNQPCTRPHSNVPATARPSSGLATSQCATAATSKGKDKL